MKKILLSFDVEEFDMPLEYGKNISFEDQIQVSRDGTEAILDILSSYNVCATFFTTVVFAQQASALIHRLHADNHELASHGYYHSSFQNNHLEESRLALQQISGRIVKGFRMPRMMPVDNIPIREAGYSYNSSLNPTFLPGRYNNFSKPRALYKANDILQLPASVTPLLRFPLFWLSFHNLPLWLYKLACQRTINHDNYLNIYFHPWEFTDLTKSRYGLPGFVSKNSGQIMIDRFSSLLSWMKTQGYNFSTIQDFLSSKEL